MLERIIGKLLSIIGSSLSIISILASRQPSHPGVHMIFAKCQTKNVNVPICTEVKNNGWHFFTYNLKFACDRLGHQNFT